MRGNYKPIGTPAPPTHTHTHKITATSHPHQWPNSGGVVGHEQWHEQGMTPQTTSVATVGAAGVSCVVLKVRLVWGQASICLLHRTQSRYFKQIGMIFKQENDGVWLVLVFVSVRPTHGLTSDHNEWSTLLYKMSSWRSLPNIQTTQTPSVQDAGLPCSLFRWCCDQREALDILIL